MSGRLLDDVPRLPEVLERMPQGDDIKLLVHLIERGGGISSLQSADSEGLIQEIYTLLIHLQGGHVETGVLRIAAEDSSPGTDFQQFSGVPAFQDLIQPVALDGGKFPQLRKRPRNSLVSAFVKGEEIIGDWVHENKAAFATLVILENAGSCAAVAIGGGDERARVAETERTGANGPIALSHVFCRTQRRCDG